MNGQSTEILSRLERGPSALDSHFMLGLAVGEIPPARPIRRTPPRKSRADRCAAVIRKHRRPMSSIEISRKIKRHRTTVMVWCNEGVRDGLLVCVQVGTHGKPAMFDVAVTPPK